MQCRLLGFLFLCASVFAGEIEHFAKDLRTWENEQSKSLIKSYASGNSPRGSVDSLSQYEKEANVWLKNEFSFLDKATKVPVSVRAAKAYAYAEFLKRKTLIPKLGTAMNESFNSDFERLRTAHAARLLSADREIKAAVRDKYRRVSRENIPTPRLPEDILSERELAGSRVDALVRSEMQRRAQEYTSLALLLPEAAPQPIALGDPPVEKLEEAPQDSKDPEGLETEVPAEGAAVQEIEEQEAPITEEVVDAEPKPSKPPKAAVPEAFSWTQYKGKPVYRDILWQGRPVQNGRTHDFLVESVGAILSGKDVSQFQYSDSGEIRYGQGVITIHFYSIEVTETTQKVIDREAPLIPVSPGVSRYQYKDVVTKHSVQKELEEFGRDLYAYKVKEQVTKRWFERRENAYRDEVRALAARIAPFKNADEPPEFSRVKSPPVIRERSDSQLPFVIADWHGRDVIKNGFLLVDWEGHIANPAFKLFVRPREGATLPLDLTISAKDSRVYFSNPSSVGAKGPRKTLTLRTAEQWQSFYVSIWPDRDGKNEKIDLSVADAIDGEEIAKIEVYVLDQDKGIRWQNSPIVSTVNNPAYLDEPEERPFLQLGFPFIEEPFETEDPWPFTITLDYTLDKSGYFRDGETVDESVDTVVQLAVNDWAYFVDEMPYRTLRPGEEVTEIQKHASDKKAKFAHANRYSLKDFVLYFVGADTLSKPHAQAGARGRTIESVGSGADKLLRSGQVLLEGIHARPGISLNVNPADWWRFTHSDQEPGELYSYLIHEVGHPLFAYPTYPNWATWSPVKGEKTQKLMDLKISDYAGEMLSVDDGDHLPDAVDRASRKQAFGAVEGRTPIEGLMPQRRWIVTKLDLLLMEEVGYRLKKTSPFVPLTLNTKTLAEAEVGTEYKDSMSVSGGVPYYFWEIAAGSLPPGLNLDSYTGKITGTPTEAGNYNFVLRVYDYDNADGIGLAHATQMKVH